MTRRYHREATPFPWKAAVVLAACASLLGPAFAASNDNPTFEQVLAAPDDVDLNLAYAKAQANDGHLLDAAAALERILMSHPNAASVRLFYAVVLYRLGDLQDANTQLALVDSAQLQPLGRSELNRYRRIIVDGRSDSTWGGQLSGGFGYNTDALGELATQFDNPILGTPHQKGTSAVFSGMVTGSTKLDQLDGITLYGSASGYSSTEISGPNNKLQYFSGEAGMSKAIDTLSLSASGIANRYWVFGDPYLLEYGGRIGADWRASSALTLSTTAEAVWQDYDAPFVTLPSGAIQSRNGGRYNAQLSAAYRIDSHSAVGLLGGYEFQTASYRGFAYNAPFVGADYIGSLGSGVYLDVQGDMRWVDYRAIDVVFIPQLTKPRKDISDYASATLGVPLTALKPLGADVEDVQDVVFEATLSYASRTRPEPLADYGGVGVNINLVWHFGDR
jgi:hypothetical protein